jgi:2-polyprenyl-3-methyl-5-hydroxy-6-metoxy-1,4-benzoquinol methylase
MELKAAILYICKALETRRNPVDIPNITKYLGSFNVGQYDLENELKSLMSEEYLTAFDTGTFLLTDRGREKASTFSGEYQKTQYNQFMMTIWHSEAYLNFCQDLYGYRWCLLNSLYKEQYHHLFNKLEINHGDTVLDIGCGSGVIINSLVGKYACRGIGIDLARDLISIIKGHYTDVTFYEMEIESIHDAAIDAEIIISTDSLYCCRDLTAVIAGLKKICKKRMYMYYSQTVEDENGDRSVLHGDRTDLARALQSNNLKYHLIDFSGDEWNLWKRENEILAKHRAAFKKEGNLKIWDGRVADTSNMLKLFEDNRASRFLYSVEILPHGPEPC